MYLGVVFYNLNNRYAFLKIFTGKHQICGNFVLKLSLKYSKTIGSIQVPVKNPRNTNTTCNQGVACKFKVLLNYSLAIYICNTEGNKGSCMKQNILNNVWTFLEISNSNFLTQVVKQTF